MLFSISLYLALALFVLGTVYRIFTWFTRRVGFYGQEFTTAQRLGAAVRGLVAVVFSARVLKLLRALIVDVVFQWRIAKEDRLRWVMHLLIYAGFILLVLMHALEKQVTASLFSNYWSTINPFLFLRNFFGLMVIAGVAIACYRRFILKVPRMMTNGMDVYAIVIVAVIILSGFLLEGTKMSSHTEFMDMVDFYSRIYDDDELDALESYWVAEYGTVSPNVSAPFEPEVLALGAEVHEYNCADCHSPNKSAFLGYAAARALGPVALALDSVRGSLIIWHIHILACFFGLAYLPFSKMFHIFSSSFSLLANAVMDPDTSLPANIATRQAMELDACTHCGTCSLRCSAAVAYEAGGNRMVLPSEKLIFLKKFAAGKSLSPEEMKAVREGIYLCSNCDRCTVVCPAGINLRDLWLSAREPLLAKGGPVFLTLSPYSFFRGLNRHRLPAAGYEKPLDAVTEAVANRFPMVEDRAAIISVTPIDTDFKSGTAATATGATFSHCFACENCTTVCPVVQACDEPEAVVGLLPHQIMRALGLGLKDLALGSPMLWNCLTCYQCQEHCPQGVKVTDIFYELKNMAVREMTVES